MYYINSMKILSKLTDYAVVCLGTLPCKPSYYMSATELSKETKLYFDLTQVSLFDAKTEERI